MSDPAPHWARRHVLFIAVFALLGLLYFGTVRPGHDWGGDFSVYVAEARNLATGAPFTQSTYIPTEESARTHPAAYPPLTAVVLAPVYQLRGLDYAAFKAVLAVFLWASLPLYYVLAIRRDLPPAAAATAVVVFGLSSIVFSLKDMVGSDCLFLFVAGATLLFVDVIDSEQYDRTRPVAAAVGTAALLLFCYLSRATGLCLILGFVLYEGIRTRRLRTYGVLTVVLLAAALLIYTAFIFNAGRHYGNQFEFRPRVYLQNVIYYLRMPAALWGGAPGGVRWVLAGGTLALAGISFIRRLARPTFIELYIVVFVGVLIFYSSGTNIRYAVPLLPLLLIYAGDTLVRLSGSRRRVVAACAVVALCASLLNVRLLEAGIVREGVAQQSFADLTAFLRQGTPADALILSWNPRVLALYTGKRSQLYPSSRDPITFDAGIGSGPAVFFVLYFAQEDRQALQSSIEHSPSHWTVVYSNSDFAVYRRQPRAQ